LKCAISSVCPKERKAAASLTASMDGAGLIWFMVGQASWKRLTGAQDPGPDRPAPNLQSAMHKEKRVMPEGTTEFREETSSRSCPEGSRTPTVPKTVRPVYDERSPRQVRKLPTPVHGNYSLPMLTNYRRNVDRCLADEATYSAPALHTGIAEARPGGEPSPGSNTHATLPPTWNQHQAVPALSAYAHQNANSLVLASERPGRFWRIAWMTPCTPHQRRQAADRDRRGAGPPRHRLSLPDAGDQHGSLPSSG